MQREKRRPELGHAVGRQLKHQPDETRLSLVPHDSLLQRHSYADYTFHLALVGMGIEARRPSAPRRSPST